jgi:ADP-ribose pyrophosphatase YjhB (NUDIX family)
MNILQWARKVQAIAQNGLEFSKDPFNRERFEQLQELVAAILTSEVSLAPGQLQGLWKGDEGYATPKVDVRGGVFRAGRVLLVRERSDGKWTLPGGWVDVGDAPSFAVEREIREESGYLAKAVKLAVVGTGGAAKEQVQMMVRRLLPGAAIRRADAADALAVAICHAHHRSSRRTWAAARVMA